MVVETPRKLTVEEFFRLHGSESNVELVRGHVVRYPMAGARHGMVNTAAGYELHAFARGNGLGRVMGNDTLIRITDDTCRGADVCFLSYARWPKEQKITEGVLEVAPELVIEVRSPSDLWTELLGKVTEYIDAGVVAVIVLDPQTETAMVIRSEARQETFAKDAALTVEDVLPGFAVPVARFFEE